MNVAAARFSYDQLHYVGSSYLQTHPETLATLGILHGMRPAPVERCRVLELACGDGNNLLPMAYTLPGSRFEGFDLAAEPLTVGQAKAAALGLTNLRLQVQDLMDFPPDAGEFDYVIAHGFYSWCPPVVRDRLLAVCGAHLAPQGIAFVSFNAYPGYHAKELQRHLMLYHLSHVNAPSPSEQARHALGALDFVARSQPEENSCRTMLTEAREFYANEITSKGDAGLAWFHHDLLSGDNAPVYFHQFMDHAASHGLQYVSDAVLRVPRVMDLAPDTHRALLAMRDDIVTQEQYLDFILNVPFRQALLCRSDAMLDHAVGAAGMRDLYIAGNITPENAGQSAEAQEPDAPQTFVGSRGNVTVQHPDAKAAMRRIGAAWPGAVAFTELRSTQSEGGTDQELAEFLLRLYVGRFASFRTRASASALSVSERPEASAVARLQAQTSPLVTNLYHERINLAAPARHLLGLLDGQRPRAELLEAMRAWITSGQAAEACREADAGTPAPETEQSRPPSLETLDADLDASLLALVKLGLMIR